MEQFRLERPFHFIAVVWGRSYCDTFLDYCIASLLSPGNLPALATRARSKFLIATLPVDWEYMSATPIFARLKQYVDPVFIEIPPCPPGQTACVHMGVGHKIACDMAHRERAYIVILTPDCMLSEGTVRNLQNHAEKGIELVWVAALRFAEEPFLAHLKSWGLVPKEARRQTSAPLVISGADMVLAGINSLHTETLAYEWDASCFPYIPSAVWWRIPGENGMLVYSFSWAPLLLDTGAIESHDTTALESWTIDGDYAFKNLGHEPRIHVVQDSDEAFISSWGPIDDRVISLAPRFTSRFGLLNFVLKAREFQISYSGPWFDPLKRKIFLRAVRWHANPVNARWRPVEKKSAKILRAIVGTGLSSALVPRLGLVLAYWTLDATSFFMRLGALTGKIAARYRTIAGSIAGNREAVSRRLKNLRMREDRARVLWRSRQFFVYMLSGRMIEESSREKNKPAAP
jgi:hypothetical protein